MSRNHYEILGVGKDAALDEIKRAYRNKARETHPDCGGGSHEQFVALQRSYATLSDEQTRDRYDRTGCDAGEMTLEEKAQRILCELLIKVIDASSSPETEDVVKIMRDSVQEQLTTIPKTIAAHEAKARKFRVAAKRIKIKSGSTHLSEILEAQANASEQLAKMCEAELDTGPELLKQLESWEYTFDTILSAADFSPLSPLGTSEEMLRLFESMFRR